MVVAEQYYNPMELVLLLVGLLLLLLVLLLV
jgi:hypothetical protein